MGQVVTLLLGMNNEAAGIVTGEEADSVFYGVVQSSSRSLIEENGADVLQKVAVYCTDGITRTVNVDKSLNFPAGWLVEITVSPDGENVERIDSRSTNGTINEAATALGSAAPCRRRRNSGYDFGGCGWDGSSQPPIGGNTEQLRRPLLHRQ